MGKITRSIIWQNITIAMITKVIILIPGADGVPRLWEAVFADLGVVCREESNKRKN